jgi:hypothetical protein
MKKLLLALLVGLSCVPSVNAGPTKHFVPKGAQVAKNLTADDFDTDRHRLLSEPAVDKARTASEAIALRLLTGNPRYTEPFTPKAVMKAKIRAVAKTIQSNLLRTLPDGR